MRGQGLLVGVEFSEQISAVEIKHECLNRHLLLTAIGDHVIRMVPPLMISRKDCDKAFDILCESVKVVAKNNGKQVA